MAEITSVEKQQEVDELLDGQNDMEETEGLWMALRKYECWVWTSDTPMCHTNWDDSSDGSGGLAINYSQSCIKSWKSTQ